MEEDEEEVEKDGRIGEGKRRNRTQHDEGGGNSRQQEAKGKGVFLLLGAPLAF